MPLVCVYRGAGPTDAWLLRHFLEGHGVTAHVRGDLTGLRGEIPVAEAWPSVWVAEADRDEADALVRQFEGPRLVHPRWTCPDCGEVNEATFDWCWRCASGDAPTDDDGTH